MVSADPQAVSAILDRSQKTLDRDSTAAERLPGAAAIANAAPADWSADWFLTFVPDVSDETAAKITAGEAWPAFFAFFRLLRKRQRLAERDAKALERVAGETSGDDSTNAASTAASLRRRAASCRAGVLDDEGIRGMARDVSLSVKAMRRQVAFLESIGFLAVARPASSRQHDPKTGRIVRRPCHRGPVPAAKVIFNAGDEHRRPANRQGVDRPSRPVRQAGGSGSKRTHPGASGKGRNAPTPITPKDISPPAAAGAAVDGRRVGTAPGLPAGEAGRHPPAEAGGLPAAILGGIGDPVIVLDGRLDPDPTPTPPAGTQAGTQETNGDRPGMVGHLPPPDRTDPQTTPSRTVSDPGDRGGRAAEDTGPADGSGLDPAGGSWLAEYRRLTGQTTAEPPDPDEAAAGLREAVREMSPAGRERARDLGEQITEEIRRDASALDEVIRQKRAADDKEEADRRKGVVAEAKRRHRRRLLTGGAA